MCKCWQHGRDEEGKRPSSRGRLRREEVRPHLGADRRIIGWKQMQRGIVVVAFAETKLQHGINSYMEGEGKTRKMLMMNDGEESMVSDDGKYRR